MFGIGYVLGYAWNRICFGIGYVWDMFWDRICLGYVWDRICFGTWVVDKASPQNKYVCCGSIFALASYTPIYFLMEQP
jgi:hypothetical protein